MAYSNDNPFDLVKQELPANAAQALPDLPFNGDAIGYFAYDLARRLEQLPVFAADEDHIPDMAVGIYSWAILAR